MRNRRDIVTFEREKTTPFFFMLIHAVNVLMFRELDRSGESFHKRVAAAWLYFTQSNQGARWYRLRLNN